MERIDRKGFGFCLISHKSFQTHRIINRSSSVFSVRSVVNSAVFGFNDRKRVCTNSCVVCDSRSDCARG